MESLTAEGRRVAAALGQRHGFSSEAVAHLLVALHRGAGRMAQFHHPEFSGGGQWMAGGMLMLSDMFDHALKARVDALCRDLAEALAGDDELVVADRAGGWSWSMQSAAGSDRWWPDGLGRPAATGSQDGLRYAYFDAPRRLAVERAGRVMVYDLGEHRISGVSQQQSRGAGVLFTSQLGPVDLGKLRLVWSSDGGEVAASGKPRVEPRDVQSPADAHGGEGREGGRSPHADAEASRAPESFGASPPRAAHGSDSAAVLDALEKLGALREKGILTEEEFAAKKADLLARL